MAIAFFYEKSFLETKPYKKNGSKTTLANEIELLFPNYKFYIRLTSDICTIDFFEDEVNLNENEVLSLNQLIDSVNTEFATNGVQNFNIFMMQTLPNMEGDFDPNKSYDVLGLLKKPSINDDGFLESMEYYKNYDPETGIYSNLVVKEENTWVTNPQTSLVVSRTTLFSFYLLDESIGFQKTTIKYFDLIHNFLTVREEVDRRRKNLIYKAELYIMLNLEYSSALELLSTVTDQRAKYIVGIKQDLITAIQNEPTFLSSEQKEYIVNILDR